MKEKFVLIPTIAPIIVGIMVRPSIQKVLRRTLLRTIVSFPDWVWLGYCNSGCICSPWFLSYTISLMYKTTNIHEKLQCFLRIATISSEEENSSYILANYKISSYFTTSRLAFASAFPCAADFVYHFLASELFCSTPSPNTYIEPRLF